MKLFILDHGAILLFDLICLTNLLMLIIGHKYSAVWTFIFAIIINIIYFLFDRKFGTPRKDGF